MNSFFLQGLQHPYLTPAHLIVLIALGVLLGQQAKPDSQKSSFSAWLVFVAFTLVSLISTRFYRTDINLEIILLAIAGCMGILTTLKLSLPSRSTLVISIVVGAFIGLDSAPVIIPGLKASKIYADMAGTWVSVSIILFMIILLSQAINRLWQGVVLRIIGSWIFASALMVLALMFAPTKI